MHEQLKLIAITGGMWRVPAVAEQPVIRLETWQVFKVEGGDQHLIGWHGTGREGRVSSKLESFDAATRQGTTRSGRVYQLCGEPGRNADALYVWSNWLPEGLTARDVTEDFVRRIEAAKQ